MPEIYLFIEGNQQGPYTEDQVRESMGQGLIPNDLPAWREGLAGWVQVETVVPPMHEPVVMAPLQAEDRVMPSTSAPISDPVFQPPPLPPQLPVSPSKPPRGPMMLTTLGAIMVALVGGLILGCVLLARINTTEQTKAWLVQAIESSSGCKRTSFANPFHDVDVTTITSYQDVSFDGDVLSIYVHESVNDTADKYYTVKIDITAIRPDSFTYRQSPECLLPDYFTTDPKMYYSLIFYSKGDRPALYSPDNVDLKTFSINIKDEQLAKRVVKALNFLSNNIKTQPF